MIVGGTHGTSYELDGDNIIITHNGVQGIGKTLAEADADFDINAQIDRLNSGPNHNN
jgi:hypothetical protein